MSKQFLKDSVGWGIILWLIGYALGIILFAFVPPSLLGWIIMPIGIALTLWVLFKKIKSGSIWYYLLVAIVWTVIAVAFDFIFLVKVFKPADGYYKLDVYLYYIFTFMLPVAAGFWRKINNGTSSKIKYKIILVAVLVVLFFAAARLISPEDTWLCQNGQWVKHGNPAAQMPATGCGQTTSTNQTSAKPEALVVDFPRPNDEITSPLKITGQARGGWFFEASFPVVLTNWDGLIIAQGAAKATGDWMTQNFVPFEATLEFTKPNYKNNGFLILKKDNPSGLPQNDASYEIPIVFK
jgi:flagellar basal body-associated protein FliL